MSNSLRPCGMWPARLLCQGILPGKNTGVYWPIWLPYPSRALHFLLPPGANSPEYLVLPEPLQPKQLHHLHTCFSLGQTQVLQGSLKNKLQWMTHVQRWK